MISDISPSSYAEHSIIYPSCRSYIRHHMVIAQENKCAMCGKDTVGRGRLDNYNKENEQKQQQENNSSLSSSTVIAVEQINGLYYTFDKTSCALMFKKFMDIYGSNFTYDD
jgi:hypothetical protein